MTSLWWALPFAGMLLSIALLPLVAPAVWHHHQGKVAAGWALAFLLPHAAVFGAGAAGHALLHVLLSEYLPFVVLLVALYAAAGGIHIGGNLHPSPRTNVAILGSGALLASVMGTTGAAMLLVRPLIRANDNRRRNAHVVVFFVFIVANAGGSLTPLGDPPLFLGFLQGVPFFWTVGQLLPETAFLVGTLLAIFYAIDRRSFRKDGLAGVDPTPDTRRLTVDGAVNLLPLAAVAGLVLVSGVWKPGIVFDIAGIALPLQQLARDALLVAVTLLSLAITPAGVRAKNRFTWAPMQEVAKLFVGIFVTMAPVLALLQAGADGPFGGVVRAVTGGDGRPLPWAYFWLTGLLSAFLDNAPTYVVFFNLAGGDAATLTTAGASTLAAISGGAVFFGALSYIGNAPNFMVKAIAEERGIRMPGFFGYMAWSCAVLLPVFAVITFVWFTPP